MTTPLQDFRAGLAMLPVRMHSPQVVPLALTIQLQENPNREPQQIGGPAVGDYQFEKIGIKDVLTRPTSRQWAADVCAKLGVVPVVDSVYEAMRNGDPRLDAVFARLALWNDPRPLPAVGDVAESWETYLRVWRPGAAKRDYDGLRRKWSVNYARVLEAMR